MNWKRTSTTHWVLLSNNGVSMLAHIDHTISGYKATVPMEVAPRGKTSPPPYFYTHDTLEEAMTWGTVEAVKRRLDRA